MKHTCEGSTTYNVKMSIADWDSVEFFYQSHDDAGELVMDTVPTNCTDDEANDRTCSITVGNIPNW